MKTQLRNRLIAELKKKNSEKTKTLSAALRHF